jgi:hypothetical protein
MKIKNYLIGLLLLVSCQSVWGQRNQFENKTTNIRRYRILYILNFVNKPPIFTFYAFIDPQAIKDQRPLTDSSSVAICGQLKIDYILNTTLDSNATILQINDVFNLYKIEEGNRKLPILLDEQLIKYPKTLFISKNQIESIKIIKIKNSNFISITLIDYYKVKNELKNINDKVR